MIHITYIHGLYSSEDTSVILKDCHFYINEDRHHDLFYAQHCFQLLYNHLKENNIYMDQDWIWLDGCMG
jgi:hypothetical protein